MAIDFNDFIKTLNKGEKSPQESPKNTHAAERLELERERLQLAKEKQKHQQEQAEQRAKERNEREERKERAERRAFIVGLLASVASLLVTMFFALIILWRF